MTRTLLVTDVRLYREGLMHVLAQDTRIAIIGAASSTDEAIECAHATKPDAILLDMAMHDSLDAARTLIDRVPDTKIVVFAIPEDPDLVIRCAEVGVSGLVTRDSSLNEIVESVEASIRGELHCSPQVAGLLFRRITTLARKPGETKQIANLTKREVRILDLIDDGLSNKEIAHALTIEVATVKNHVHNILEKLQVRSRGEASAVMRRARHEKGFPGVQWPRGVEGLGTVHR